MNFNEHSKFKGLHSFLSPSSYHWINYDEEKLANTYVKYLAREKGTRLHEFACEAITLGIKLPRNKQTLNMYVNDAIGYVMTPEQPLVYSENAFGTADAISFRKNLLRIHDLKTGESPVSMNQLLVYAALFCLEYKMKPSSFDTELRIYQSNEVVVHHPEVDEIVPIMDKIISFDKIIRQINEEEK